MESEQIFCNHKWSSDIVGWKIVPVDLGFATPINDYRPMYSEDVEWCHLCGEKRKITKELANDK